MPTEPIISDAEIQEAFRGTNFGRTDFRELLRTSVFKKMLGYHCGYMITTIMKGLGLIGKTEKVTVKGRNLLRQEYHHLISRGG